MFSVVRLPRRHHRLSSKSRPPKFSTISERPKSAASELDTTELQRHFFFNEGIRPTLGRITNISSRRESTHGSGRKTCVCRCSREPPEYDLCRIEGAKLVPLGSLAANVNGLLGVDEVICYCHHGMRSLDLRSLAALSGHRARQVSIGRHRALVYRH